MINYNDKNLIVLYLQSFLRDYFGETVKETNNYKYYKSPSGNTQRRRVRRYIITDKDTLRVTGYLNAQTYSSIALYIARNYPNEGFPCTYSMVTKGEYVPVSSYKKYNLDDGDNPKTSIITPEDLYTHSYYNSTTVESNAPGRLDDEKLDGPISNDDPIYNVEYYRSRLVKGYKVFHDGTEDFYEKLNQDGTPSGCIDKDTDKIYLDINDFSTYRYFDEVGKKGYKRLGQGSFVYYEDGLGYSYITEKKVVDPLSDEELLSIITSNIDSIGENPLSMSIPDRVISYFLDEVVNPKSTEDEIVRLKKLIYRSIETKESLKYNSELFDIVYSIQRSYKLRNTKEGDTNPSYSGIYRDFKVTGYVDPLTEILIKDHYSSEEELS